MKSESIQKILDNSCLWFNGLYIRIVKAKKCLEDIEQFMAKTTWKNKKMVWIKVKVKKILNNWLVFKPHVRKCEIATPNGYHIILCIYRLLPKTYLEYRHMQNTKITLIITNKYSLDIGVKQLSVSCRQDPNFNVFNFFKAKTEEKK